MIFKRITHLKKKLAASPALSRSARRRLTEMFFVVAGVAAIAWGLLLIYRPLALIFVGAAFLAEVFSSRRDP